MRVDSSPPSVEACSRSSSQFVGKIFYVFSINLKRNFAWSSSSSQASERTYHRVDEMWKQDFREINFFSFQKAD